nr:invertebrate-type lysozyme 3-like [Onthophagus taurus]
MSVKNLFLFVVLLNFYQEVFLQDIFVSNLDDKCLRCLCVASSNCDINFPCTDGFCGPYILSKPYYDDATKGRDMDPTKKAFEKCALDYTCAKKIVKYYVARFAKDCNKDGVTDCTDYAMINFNGGYGCELDLFRSAYGRQYAERYYNCSI